MATLDELVRITVVSGLMAFGCFGCAGEEEFEFGADEMNGTVSGAWVGTLNIDGAEATELTLDLERRAPGMSPACGNRTMVHTNCIDMTSMSFDGHLTTDDGAYVQAPVTGEFMVVGLKLDNGDLRIRLPDGVVLSAFYDGTTFQEGDVQTREGTIGTVALRRP